MAQLTWAPTREHSARVALIAVGFVGLGLPAGAIGAAWTSIEQDLHRPTTDLTIALVCFSIGYFVFGALAGLARRHMGAAALLVAAAIAAATGLVVCAAAPSWLVFLVGVAALGSGGGALGAAVGPLLLAAVFALGGSWRLAFVALFVCVLAMTLAFLRWGARFGGAPTIAAGATETPTVTGVRRSTVVVALIAAVAVVYVGSEVSAGQWGPSLIRDRGASAATAGLWIAGFWLGLGGGRLVAAAVAGWLSAARLLALSLAVVLLGALFLWWKPTLVVGNLGFVVLGIGMSAVFPTVVSLTPSWVGTDRAPIAIGMQIAGSAAGGLGFPVVIGRLARHSGLEVVGPVITTGVIILVVLIAALQRLTAPRSASPR
jgi:fucose permease